MAIVVLVVGILGTFTTFDTSQRLSLVSERHATMTQIAQREIERIEGIPYSQIGLSSTPSTSTDPTNPDYYVVAGSPPQYEWNRSSSSSRETLDIDTTNGTIAPVQSWNETTQGGTLSGYIYDFVTWTTDPAPPGGSASACSPGCPSSQDYKRITVAVTMTSGLQPTPVYVASVIADPQAAPAGGTSNGTAGNPLANPATTCQNSSGQTVQCTSGIDSGNANTYFLHDWAATNSGTPQTPSADHTTHPTAGTTSGGTCTTSQSQASNSSQTSGCPIPDLMNKTAPAGTTSTPLYNYSTDQCADTCYPGGRLLQPTCSGLCSGSSGGGTGSTSDCTGGAWSSGLLNVQSEFWVTNPLSSSKTLTGAGGISLFTQTLGSAAATVSFCAEIYDVPPSGTASSLADLDAYPPVALGGGAYVPPTDPSTGSNWPLSLGETSFVFTFSNQPVTVPAGDRIGLRVWMKATQDTPIDVVYDNPNYPSQLELNTQ